MGLALVWLACKPSKSAHCGDEPFWGASSRVEWVLIDGNLKLKHFKRKLFDFEVLPKYLDLEKNKKIYID